MTDPVLAAVLREIGGPLSVEEIDLPQPGPGQVRVRLAATGVCHSDLSLARGTLKAAVPVVLGHEGAGHVVSVGDGVTAVAPGDPVVLNWTPPCGQCWFCRHGEPYLCAHAGDASGRPYAALSDGTPVHPGLGTAAFATETVVGANACIPLPPGIPMDQAALLGCAVLTGVGAVLNSARVARGRVGGRVRPRRGRALGAAGRAAGRRCAGHRRRPRGEPVGAGPVAGRDGGAGARALAGAGGARADRGPRGGPRGRVRGPGGDHARGLVGDPPRRAGDGRRDGPVRRGVPAQRARGAVLREDARRLHVRQQRPGSGRPGPRRARAGRPAGPGRDGHPHPAPRRDRDPPSTLSRRGPGRDPW